MGGSKYGCRGTLPGLCLVTLACATGLALNRAMRPLLAAAPVINLGFVRFSSDWFRVIVVVILILLFYKGGRLAEAWLVRVGWLSLFST